MTPISLLKTTALSGLMILMPLIVPAPVDAKVKIKAVNANGLVAVKPRVKVSPKVKIKKAKIRIKTKPKTRKVAVVKKAAAPRQGIVSKPKQPFTVTASLSTKSHGDLVHVAVPTQRPDREIEVGQPMIFTLGEARYAGLAEQNQIKDASVAARALEELREVASLVAIRHGATVGSDLGGFEIERNGPISNQERLGKPQGTNQPNWLGEDLGSGPEQFAGLDNSHSRDAPSNPWAVTKDTVNQAKDGVAGSTVHESADHSENGSVIKRVDSNGLVEITKVEDIHRASDGGDLGTIQTRALYDADGFLIERVTNVYYGDRLVRTRRERIFDVDGNPSFNEETYHPGTGAMELKNPDHVGGSDCNNISCILKGETRKGLQLKDVENGKTPGAMPQDPHNGAYTKNQVQSSIATNDLLETWDEDNRRRGGGQLQPKDLCFHSEC
ncbi:MAG: hypothetical protein AAGA53_07590 [Pseudomonadota bacterium]